MSTNLPGSLQKASEEVQPFIDGAPVSSSSVESLPIVNPSTGATIRSLPAGNALDVERAVESARRAFDEGRWLQMGPAERKWILLRFADHIAGQAGTLDHIDAVEMGKPISLPLFNANAAASLARYYAESVDKTSGSVFPSDHTTFVTQRRVPRGVVAAITPWNFPTFNAVLKIAPALAAGNCVVLKPSELSSHSAVRLAQLALAAGVPPGVFNVILGAGGTVGRALALHRDVDMIAFTGSTNTGRRILEYSAQSNMKHVLAECGGKSPQVVFDDGVPVEVAAKSIASFLLANQGQICSVGSRLLAQRSIADRLVELIRAEVNHVIMGDACDPKTTFGPLASSVQQARVIDFISGARAQGGRVIIGGGVALTQSGGFFVEPTIIDNISHDSRLVQEEVFGPVLSVTPFDTEQEASRLANDTRYGLAAYIWTADLSRGMRMSKSIRSSVFVNAAPPTEGAGFAASAEPFRESGLGAEGGLAGLESYTRRQLTWFSHA